MLSSGQSYKDSTIVNYDPRVVIYERKMFIILATGPVNRTHDLLNMSLLPLQLDQCPCQLFVPEVIKAKE